MANKALTDAQLQAAADALRAHAGNINAAAKALGYPRPTFENHARTALRKGFISAEELDSLRDAAKQAKRLPPERESLHSGRRLPQTADECWALLDDYIGRSQRPLVSPPLSKRKAGNAAKRIVVASDFHAPFHDAWAVSELIRRERGADTLIINGDLQDFYSISRFLKYEPVTMETELAAVDALLGQLSAAFPDVLIVSGNHDKQRFEKQLRSLLSMEMMHVIEFLTGGNLSVIHAIAKRYPNVRFAQTHVGRHHLGWFAQEGDLICAHAEKYSRVPGAALRGIEEWFSDQQGMLGIQPWRVLVQAHTHAMGVFPWRADKLLVECGCMCADHGYQLTAQIGGRPQRRGYITLEQRAGVTDLNSVRMVWLDPEREQAA
jgi:predicted phosphodiesterase